MVLDQIVAGLNFVTTYIHKVEIESHRTSITADSVKIKVNMSIRYKGPEIENDKKIGKLLLELNVVISGENDTIPDDRFKLVLEGVFQSDASKEDDDFLELLNINGGAALYSIARSKLEVLSGMVYDSGKIVVPMVNMVDFFKNAQETA